MSELVKKTVFNQHNTNGPDGTYLSIKSNPDGHIDLVIGASFQHRCASAFSKEGLGELISILQELYDAME